MIARSGKKSRRRQLCMVLMLVFFAVALVWFNTDSATGFRSSCRSMLLDELVSINPPGAGSHVDVIYILGGKQSSIEFKAKALSLLYSNAGCPNIWVYSQPGITEFNPLLGRNWTNNEWAMMKLNQAGFAEEQVTFIAIDGGFFGTYAEAQHVCGLLQEKKYRSALLIAQPYHTRRVRISFSRFIQDENITLYIQDSGEPMSLRHLVIEFVKLKIYQYVVLF